MLAVANIEIAFDQQTRAFLGSHQEIVYLCVFSEKIQYLSIVLKIHSHSMFVIVLCLQQIFIQSPLGSVLFMKSKNIRK